ncbi:MAG: thiol-disulfide isomerase/thioredoxin [Psychromonas sp.]|jgi:thiol-disulfide isomerase/thioredoxin|uniref:protein disulfide oxidoreductase n=1 Tax=Psychromonas sp. TaxID=1884585 RepID=UPI0039E57795
MAANSKAKKPLLSWIKEALIFLLIAIVIGWGIDLWRSQSMASGTAPDSIASSLQGEQIDLQALSQEKPVLVYFWAIWCPVCSAVSPSVDFMADYYPVVSVALRSGEDKRIRQYLNGKEYDFSVVNDPKGLLSRAWGVSVTPTIFIIDKGEIKSVTTGFTSPLGIWLRLLFA